MAGDIAASEQFARQLSQSLAGTSARKLAERSGWGRTTVTEIKLGRQLPTAVQLEDLLMAAGVAPAEIARLHEDLTRLHEMTPPKAVAGEPTAEKTVAPVIPGFPAPRRRYVMGAALVLVLMGFVWVWPTDSEYDVSGEVMCESGAPVVGVWIVNRDDSGTWARVRPGPDGFVVFNGTALGDSHRLNVGCGGTPSQWKAEARSPWSSQNDTRLVCDDSPATIATAPFFGRCSPP